MKLVKEAVVNDPFVDLRDFLPGPPVEKSEVACVETNPGRVGETHNIQNYVSQIQTNETGEKQISSPGTSDLPTTMVHAGVQDIQSTGAACSGVVNSSRKNPNVEAIVNAYEVEGIDAADIAVAFDWEESLVRIVLAQKSRVYRIRENVNSDGSDFEIISKDDFEEVRAAFVAMVKSDNVLKPADRAKNMRWLLDEKKGRNDAVKTAPVSNNLVQINNFIKRNNDKYKERVGKLRGKVLEAETV